MAEAEARLKRAVRMALRCYLPMEGLNTYRHTIAPLLFGADHPVLQQQRVATIQTLGGSGALKVGADFLKRYFPDAGVWGERPHLGKPYCDICRGRIRSEYFTPWYDDATNGIRFNDLLATLNTLPARSIVLLHPCCHNPTGADLTPSQWDAVIEIGEKARDLIPFLDIAYQGFGAGMDDDAYVIRRHCQPLGYLR
ncbi:tyrosine aminotransferase, tyrosine repressible [Salmonella enterica subsp. enterica]|uniref:Tyrosine aminotransferase, tyrosine repressible n=1 Tax=Salmonella enterica I TaxID=59201 RepID=A0A447TPU1_SALET|nr:tyrosine aminotransferase, tyrosine repressible [Salmonella enterica subsp. enterica]